MTKPILSFEEFDYNKMKELLPEGYEPLPYIEIPQPKSEDLIKLVGFSSEMEALSKMKSLLEVYPSNKYQVVPNKIEQLIKEYALIIPAGAQSFLDDTDLVEETDRKIISLTTFLPPLYRFFDSQEYEDRFFSSGELLLTTFKRCITKEIKDRQDLFENKNKIIIKDGCHSIETVMQLDFDALLLCTSLSQINTKLNGSTYKFGFKINNTAAFFDVLTRALVSKGIQIGELVQGPCIYSDKLITLDATGSGIAKDFMSKSEKGKLDFMPTTQFILNNAQNHIIMNKPSNFSSENEFRTVWKLAKPTEKASETKDMTINPDGSIIIKVPEIVAFCEKL